MTSPAKAPKDRRQDTQARIRFALRKVHDRMFSVNEKPAEPPKPKPEKQERH